MYPLQCYAGIPMPVKSGKFQIVGYKAAVETTTSASQLVLVDDEDIIPTDKFGKLIGNVADINSGDKKTVIVNKKGIASVDGMLEEFFPEPIKTRYGISVHAENIVGGSLCVYVR